MDQNHLETLLSRLITNTVNYIREYELPPLLAAFDIRRDCRTSMQTDGAQSYLKLWRSRCYGLRSAGPHSQIQAAHTLARESGPLASYCRSPNPAVREPLSFTTKAANWRCRSHADIDRPRQRMLRQPR